MANDDDYGRDSGDSISTRLTYLLIGGGIGAILALLFAPKSGHELRGDIAHATRQSIDRSRAAAQQLSDRAGEYYEATRASAAERYAKDRWPDAEEALPGDDDFPEPVDTAE